MYYYKTTTGEYFGAFKYEQCDDRLIEVTKPTNEPAVKEFGDKYLK